MSNFRTGESYIILMERVNKVKIFLSWSGTESKQLATIFKDWLPNVLQYVDPYMSAEDITLGERWNYNITNNLHESIFGLIFVTPSNINAPWINYEAGALSKTLDSKVVPILYKSDVMILNDGPLKQFQSAKNLEKDSVLSLLKSINNSNIDGKLDEARLEKAFEMWWGTLLKSIEKIVEEPITDTNRQNEPTEKELLNVIYSKLTTQEKLLKTRNRINTRIDDQFILPKNFIKDLEKGYIALDMCRNELVGGPYDSDFNQFIEESLTELKHAISYIKRRTNSDDENIEGIKRDN